MSITFQYSNHSNMCQFCAKRIYGEGSILIRTEMGKYIRLKNPCFQEAFPVHCHPARYIHVV